MTYLLSYLFGSILFGVIIAKALKIGNLREKGSGNVGATNIARVSGNKKIGILVAVLDCLKGALPVILGREFGIEEQSLGVVGLAAVLGHIFPIWHKFKGGKGVATFIGINLALNWVVGVSICFVWGITFLVTKTSSISSLATVIACTMCYIWMLEQLLPIGISSLLVMIKHKDNIRRLIKGKEGKIL